ncbi:hypothetical protein [Bacillus kandeliae]|uniref:hypothetical protein n=1 Tax=Bacillus kandeliae TaxID=3129297 RepID=UPI0039B754BE
MEEKKEYDLNIVYDYNEYLDISAGRCDNCGKFSPQLRIFTRMWTEEENLTLSIDGVFIFNRKTLPQGWRNYSSHICINRKTKNRIPYE